MAVFLAIYQPSSTHAQGTEFTYAGRLDAAGIPANGLYDLRFAVYDAAADGVQQGGSLTNTSTAISNGQFTVTLDFGNQFPGAARWLEIGVRPHGGGTFDTLTPRQKFTPVPYAITAGGLSGTVTSASIAGVYANPVTFSNAANSFAGSGAGLSAVNALSLGGLGANAYWQLGGNAGTTAGTHFIGTTDTNSLELRVNNQPGFRISYATNEYGSQSVNIVAGDTNNFLGTTNVFGNFIAGGGSNWIGANSGYNVIGGGGGNSIQTNASFATIPGGHENSAAKDYSFAAGIRARAKHSGSFVWNGTKTIFLETTGDQQFLIGALGGVGIGTNNPQSQLHVRGTVTADAYVGDGSGLSNVTSIAVITNLISDSLLPATLARTNQVWLLNGNYGTSLNTQFLGTADEQPLELRVNGQRALRLEPNATSPNVVGGYAGNVVSNGFVGVVIAGGGEASNPNQVGSSFATIGGGMGNHIGTSSFNTTIAGGQDNAVYSNVTHVTIGGGFGNVVEGGSNIQVGGSSTIAGGINNRIEASSSAGAIGGGVGNIVGGIGATVPGGEDNQAKGIDSFAAGRRARALHASTFVWSDFEPPNSPVFASTSSNQFLIRALGGVGIGTNNPQSQLHVRGTVTADAYVGDGSGLSNVTSTVTNPIADNLLPATVARLNTNQTFIASNTFSGVLIATNGANRFRGEFNGVVSGDGSGLTNVIAQGLAPSSVTNLWKLNGNAGTNPTNHFLGTTDDQPLELRANDHRALRLEPASAYLGAGSLEVGYFNAPNIVAGASVNRVDAGVVGASIGGGGADWWYHTLFDGASILNHISQNFGTIGGGGDNTINGAGGVAGYFIVGSTIGGGSRNTASGDRATVGGGFENSSINDHATVAGGMGNVSSGSSATVPGGKYNEASGNLSFAAGHRAKATNEGTFVWADSQDTNFFSTANNQFLIRASGGVGIGTNNPQAQLHVHGTVRADAFVGDGSGLSNVTFADGQLPATLARLNTNQTFTAANTFAGVMVATNGGNQFTGQFTGNGAGLTNLNVGNLAGVAYVGSNQTFTASNTFSGVVIATNAANQLSGTFTGTLAGNGVGVTNLNASTLATGTVPDIRLSANVSLLGQSIESAEITDGTIVNADINASAGIVDSKLATISTAGKVANSATTATASNAANAIVARDGAGNFAAGSITAAFVGNGLNLTNLNASNLSTGTLPDARLSNNLARLNVVNTFTAPQTITNAGQVPLQVLGNDVGGTWVDLGNSSLGGRTWNFISSGVSNSEGPGKLLFRDATQGVLLTLSTNGNVGIGTTSPGAKLEVVGTLKATAFLGSLSATNLGGGIVSSAVSFTNLGNSFVGNGTGLTNVNAETLDGLDSSAFWGLVGNSVSAGQFLGSVNNQVVEFRVNNARALRLEPNGTSPNVIGGNFSNTVGSNAVGATIAGGGRTQDPNRVSADYGTVGGGRSNTVYGIDGTVSGGFANLAGNTAAVVGGGWINSASGAGSTIGGGYFNSASTNFATVGGGATNYASARFATVGGGTINLAWGDYTTIAGGFANFTTNQFATIGGGNQNQALGSFATVAGGFGNEANGTSGSVGGGDNNKNHSLHATIAGGNHNTILGNATGASVAGGAFHLINSNAFYSVVGGGAGNVIRSNLSAATIAGGEQNFVGASYSFIAGGAGNTNLSFVGSISGGALNRIEPNSSHAAISGGEWNRIEESATAASIGGGKGNVISTAATAAVISGGESNQVFGLYATVAGGRQNSAQADYSFAAGWRAVAKYPGSFVWADSTGVAFESSNPNQFLVRAGGGVGINTDNPGSSLEVNGGIRARGGSPGNGGGNNNGYAFSGNGGDTDSGMFSSADGQLEFYNNAQERVRITSLGKVGIGTIAPDTLLHVKDSGQDIATLESSATGGTWTSLRNTSAGGKDWRTISTGSGNTEGAGKLLLFVDGARRFEFRANGDFITTGTVNPPSDRNVKRDFAPTDAQSVLEKVARLPIQTWAYTNDATIRHIGPVAQDFHAAFGLGTDDKHIATVDADGVALAAIQGLNQKVEAQLSEMQSKDARIAELEQRLAAIEARLKK